MTKRKPPERQWADWVERQIADAQARGDFDRLEGAGKPMRGLDQPYDETWWVKEKLRREGVSHQPRTLELRRAAERLLERCLELPSAAVLRQQATQLNREIEAANRGDLGPLAPQPLLDVDALCLRWGRARERQD